MTEIIVGPSSAKAMIWDIRFLPWKRALERTKDGKYDRLFTVWYRPEREEWFVFSNPLPANEIGFFRHKDHALSYASFEDLKDQTIGVVRGYAAPPGFEEAGLKTAEATDDEENLRKLHKGRVELALVDKVVGTHTLNTVLSDAKSDLVWVDPSVTHRHSASAWFPKRSTTTPV